jgi:hypothetical protein
MFPKFTMPSSTCSAYKHLTFIPYALASVVEDEGDFTVAEGHEHPLVVFRFIIECSSLRDFYMPLLGNK